LPERWLRGLGTAIGVILALAGLRWALAPASTRPRTIELSAAERGRVTTALRASAVARADFVRALASKRVLLVGESHFCAEPQLFLQDLLVDLYALDHRSTVLLLELPGDMQEGVDTYLMTGEDAVLASAWGAHEALPYQATVHWARDHRSIVRRVIAYDEGPLRIALKRLFLGDTRNRTMARAIRDTVRSYPDARVIAFGGRLHMMNAGRYLYDSPSRAPVGARLPQLGIPASERAAVWLFAGTPPASGAWTEQGAVALAGEAGQLPIGVLEDVPVFRASRVGEVADFAVYLGPATRLRR
jgi:hypothetical protein